MPGALLVGLLALACRSGPAGVPPQPPPATSAEAPAAAEPAVTDRSAPQALEAGAGEAPAGPPAETSSETDAQAPEKAAPAVAPDAGSPDADAPPAALPSDRSPVPSSRTGAPGSDLGATLRDTREGPLHGALSLVYRGRATGDEDDHDLYGTLSLDAGDPGRDPWSGHLFGRVQADLDGRSSEPDPWFDLADTESGSVDLRLYEAWAQRRDVGALERVRLGRQTLWETPVDLWFDGLYAETRPFAGQRALRFGAYGGIPFYLYESSRSDDLLAGLFAELVPWHRGRVRFDWFHVEEDGRFGEHENDLFGVHLWQQLSPQLAAEAAYTRLEDQDRDLRVAATWADARKALVLRAEYYELLEGQQDLALDLDPFSAFLFEQFPFRQVRLSLSKQLAEKLGATAGYDLRRVSDDDDVGEFNRDFDRGFLTTTWSDVGTRGLDLSVTGEHWDSPQNDIASYGFDVTRRLGRTTASLGTYYSLYKIDVLNQQERENVRSYYLRVRRKIDRNLSWDVRYEFENADIDDFHTLRLSLSWRF